MPAFVRAAATINSTGSVVFILPFTKAGNGRARRILVEAAWSYRYPPRVSREKQMKVAAAPRAVREIAWKSANEVVRAFSVAHPEGQAADRRRHGDRPRAGGLHLGDQSRGRGISCDGEPVARGHGPLEL